MHSPAALRPCPAAAPASGVPRSRGQGGLRGAATGESRPTPRAGTSSATGPSGEPGQLGAEEEPGEAILTGEGWRGRTAQRAAGMEQFPPLFPPSVGRAGFGGLFHLPSQPLSLSRPRTAMPASSAVLQPSPSKRQKGSVPEEPTARLRFTKLSENAFAPSKGSARAAGYDLYR